VTERTTKRIFHLLLFFCLGEEEGGKNHASSIQLTIFKEKKLLFVGKTRIFSSSHRSSAFFLKDFLNMGCPHQL